ncbi:hypothetical protein SLS62_000289 [Diatrype stigma]|uniref:AB hydrolase-1 domain-containing protein n=1 Tax=Diatrype stigma TaxID=117547 RepID=A0AAN9YUX7_9PEZI
MANREITILLLHGSFHPASVWDDLISHLDGRGYRMLAPQLCFCGSSVGGSSTEEPIKSWQECIDQVRALLSQETSAGRDVVLVNHSMGGIIGCSAVKGFTARDPSALSGQGATVAMAAEGEAEETRGVGRVIGIVQVTATTLHSPEDKRDFYARRLGKVQTELVHPNGWSPVPPANFSKNFYNDLAPEEAEKWAGRLLPMSEYLNIDAEGIYGGFGDVPTWFVVCEKDLVFKPEVQEQFVAKIREVNPDVTVRRLESSHSPMLSRPAELAGVVEEAVRHCAIKARGGPGRPDTTLT